ncbi:MAG: class I SAM-dependent methyltransferase [Planctomycetia bacterium]|nr:class I SAM-dependent methyltransferase [Planctomycetia bacterium]
MLPGVEAACQEYNKLASTYDRKWRAYIDATLRAIVEGGQFQGQERVLDIACGTGELERRLLSHWPNLFMVGVDVSRKMLDRAAAKNQSSRVAWVQAEVARLPFPDQSFDHAICANSFHYFPSPAQSLHEIRRIVRPAGQFVLVDWCDDYLSCKLCSLWLRLTEPAFCATYTLRSCQSLLEQSGFTVIHTDRFRAGWLWGMMQIVCRRN